MKRFIFASLLISQSWALCPALKESSLTVAILPIKDRLGINSALLEGMPDMMATELVQSSKVRVVERSQVTNALEAQKLEGKNLSESERTAMGKWLGAKAFLMGSLTPLGSDLRLDLRLVSTQSGELLCASSATANNADLSNLTHLAMKDLWQGAELKQANTQITVSAPPSTPQATFKVQFKIVNSLFNETPIPVQKLRFYIDQNFIGESRNLNRINQEIDLGEYPIAYGSHLLRIQVGSVDNKGNWKNSLQDQPDEISLYVNNKINASVQCTEIFYDQKIQYKCSVE